MKQMRRVTMVAALLLIGCTTTSSRLTPAERVKAQDLAEMMFTTLIESMPDLGMTKRQLVERWGYPDFVQKKGDKVIWWYFNVGQMPMEMIFEGDYLYEIK